MKYPPKAPYCGRFARLITTLFVLAAGAALADPAPGGAQVHVDGSWCSLGTSITWYNNHVAYPRFTRGYQTCVQRSLVFTNFVNMGHNGGRVQDQLGEVAWADYYTIEHGINDLGTGTPVGTLDDYKNNTQNGTFYAYYRQLIDEVRATNANAKIILCTPRRGYDFETYLPSGSDEPQTRYPGLTLYLTNYVDAVRAIAKYENFVVADLFANAGSNDTVIAETSIDHALHPNDDGHRMIANEVLRAFGEMLDIEITPTYTLERWVSPSGDDTADGLTEATAWRTPQKAVDFFGTGEGTVRLASGTFEGAQPLLNVTNVISVIGAGRETTFLKPDNSATEATVIVGDNVTLQGVCVTNNTTGCGVRRIVGTLPDGVANYAYLVTPKVLDCTLTANLGGFASDSINAYSALQRCRIVNNNGVGVNFPYTSFGAIRNCLIAGNVCASSSYSGGVYLGNKSRETAIEYCTIVGNTSPVCGGLRVEQVGGTAMGYRVRLRNTIVRDNRAGDSSTTPNIEPLSGSCTNANCCFTSADAAAIGATYCTDCVTGETAFKNPGAGDYRIQGTSCCLDAGYDISGSDASTTDVDGNVRLYGTAPDIGCFERQAVTESECAAFGLPADYSFSSGTTLSLTASITPADGASASDYDISWSLVSELTGETVATGTASTFAPTVTTSGKHTIILTITNRNDSSDTATQTITDAFYTRPSVVYVKSPESGHTGAAWPYDSWDNAATNIIEAMTNVVTGGKVILGEGRHAYDAPYTSKDYLNSYLTVDRDITIMGGAANRAAKIVTGRYWGHLVTLNSSGSVLSNLTITGWTRGGTACALYIGSNGGTAVDCDFANSRLSGYQYETAVTLDSANARLSRCRFIANHDDRDLKGTAGQSTLQLNGGLVENCLFVANTNYFATVRVNNNAARLINCTFVSNTTDNASGNIRFTASPAGNALLNCIFGKVLTRTGADTDTTWSIGDITQSKLVAGTSNCCFEVGTTLGANPIAGNPGFFDPASGNYSLGDESPCINAGLTTADVGTLDYAHNPRVYGDTVDIGCYEYQGTPSATVVTIAKPTAASGLVYTAAEQTGVTYDSRLTVSGTVKATAKGDYTATFTLPANTTYRTYTWTDETTEAVAINWSIAARPVTDSGVTFGEIPDQTYTGSAIEPSVTMSYAGAARTLGTDFTVVYSDNTEIGTATATVTGTGNFTGEKALSFNIVEAPAPSATPPVAAYVQDGLIFELDGIDNVGVGQHSDAPSALVDLIQGKTVTLNATEKAAVTEDTFLLAPASGMYTVNNIVSSRPTALTLEVFCKPVTIPSGENYAAIMHVADGCASFGFTYKTSAATESGLMMAAYRSSTSKIQLYYKVPNPLGETASSLMATATPFYRYTQVVSDGVNAPTLYINCTNKTAATDGGGQMSWGVDNHLYLGNSRNHAKLHATRVYTRVLTDAERAQNDAFDRMRFEDATSNDTGYAWIGAAACVRLNVTAGEDGSVQATGAATGESWPVIGTAVTLTPVPDAGAVFERWEGDTNGLAVAENGALSFTADMPRALTCVFYKEKPVATSGISAKAYVQEGLVANWDGVENYAYGERYANIGIVGWVDLVNGCTLTTNFGANATVTTKDNGVSLVNATLRAYDEDGKATALANALRSAPRTIEIAGAHGASAAAHNWLSVLNAQTLASDKGILLWSDESVSSAYKSVLRVAGGGDWAATAGDDLGFAAGADFTRAAVFSGLDAGAWYTNGFAATALSFTGTPVTYGEMTEAGITLGASAYAALPTDATTATEYHAVRVYNRALTDVETRRNRAFDRMRFEGATTNDTGYAWVDDALKIRFKAWTTQVGATVSVNGGDATQEAELWRAPDATAEITYVATIPDGMTFRGWTGETDGLDAEDLMNLTLTVSADRPRALKATCSASGTLVEGIPTTEYVQQGLVFHIDAIENVQQGVHADETAQIVDLVDGKVVELSSDEQGLVISNAFTLTAEHTVAMTTELATLPKNMQIEMTAKPTNALTSSQCFLDVAQAARLGFYPNAKAIYTEYSQLANGATAYTQRDARWFYHPYTTTSKLYLNPALRTSLNWYRSSNIGTDWPHAFINAKRSTNSARNGNITILARTQDITLGNATVASLFHAVRVYTNKLTDVQLRRNDALDALRFCGESTNDVGYAWVAASQSFLVGARAMASVESPYYGTASLTANGVAIADGECYWRPIDESGSVNLVFTAKPYEHCEFDHWEGDTNGLTAAEQRTNPLTVTTMESSPRFLKAVFTGPAIYYWTGNGSSNPTYASNNNNWLKNGAAAQYIVPTDGSFILLGSSTSAKDLFWNIDVTPGGWIQTSDYSGTVTFQNGIVTTGYTVYGAETTETYEGTEYTVKETQIDGDVVLEGGTWTHTVQPNLATSHAQGKNGLGVYRLQVKATGDMKIGEGVSVTALEKGFNNSLGPACGANAKGPSHGGIGGAGKDAYGSSVAPVANGSGGTRDTGRAGGVVRLIASGSLTLDGTVSADSTRTSGYYKGSGGSVWITAGDIAGSGSILARGVAGSGADLGSGGGRISVVLTSSGSDFSKFSLDNISAVGGWKTGSGTIYLETPADGAGQGMLIVRGHGQTVSTFVGKYCTAGSTICRTGIATNDNGCVFSRVVITNGAVLCVQPDATLGLKSLKVQSKYMSVIQLTGGELAVHDNLIISNMLLHSSVAGSAVTVTKDDTPSTLTISNATFVVDNATTMTGSLALDEGGLLTHKRGPTQYLNLTIDGDLTVRGGGTVDVSTCGYGQSTVSLIGSSGMCCHGGLYGSDGYMTYGSITRPYTHGGGVPGGYLYGGGVAKIKVTGTTTVNGPITSSGTYYQDSNGKTGAGGSIWIETGSIQGYSNILAQAGVGGFDTKYCHGAGGGRIALTLTDADADFSDYHGIISARGLTYNSKGLGGCGTVYLRKGGEGEHEGTLIIANDFVPAPSQLSTLISTNVTDTWVGSVVISNNGVLAIQEGASLTVSKDWRLVEGGAFSNGVDTVTAEEEAIPGGTVIFTNAAVASTVYGSSSFYHLACTEPDKEIRFEAGAVTNTVTGSMTLRGAEGHRVKVRSSTGGTKAYLCLKTGATTDLAWVDVKDSDARPGEQIDARGTNSVGANYLNWLFDSTKRRPFMMLFW